MKTKLNAIENIQRLQNKTYKRQRPKRRYGS